MFFHLIFKSNNRKYRMTILQDRMTMNRNNLVHIDNLNLILK